MKDEKPIMGIKEIELLIDQANYDQALEEIIKLNQGEKLEGIILRSQILTRQGGLNEALTVAKEAIEESQRNGTKIQKLKALISLGYAHLAHQDMIDLEKVIKQANQLLPEIQTEQQAIKKECKGALAYLQGYFAFLKGELQDALSYLEKSLVIHQALEKQYNMVETLTAIGFVHLEGTGKHHLAFDYFQRSLSISESLGNATALAHSLNRMGCYYNVITDYDKALSYFEKSLELYQELENEYWIDGVNNNIANTYTSKGNYDLALHYLQRNLERAKQQGYDKNVALYLANIGGIQIQKGEVDLGIKQLEKGAELHEARGEKIDIIRGITLIGISYGYILKGDLERALDNAKRHLNLSKEVGATKHTAWGLFFISHIYSLKGEPQDALDNITHGLKLFTELEDKQGVAWCLSQQGVIYKLLGNMKRAEHYLLEGWKLFQKTIIGGSLAFMGSHFLFELILIAQELDTLDKAKEYLTQLQEISKTSKSKLIKLRTRFAEGIVLAMSKRGVKKFQAQEIFQAIVEEEAIDFNLMILAMLNLCELLILEMKISTTAEELLQEVTKVSTQFYEIAKSQKSPMLLVMALILKTKLTLVHSGDFEEASILLSEAKQIAEEKKLGNLLVKVKIEQETVQAELNKWNEMIQRKASIQERVEHARIANWLVEAKKIQEAWTRPTVELLNQ
ncbi:MAG: tetratricopeptide repeat protein [Candidatus Hodarchaeales archaeon]|jgi:tetratricopeptide (TPR) repeat protein